MFNTCKHRALRLTDAPSLAATHPWSHGQHKSMPNAVIELPDLVDTSVYRSLLNAIVGSVPEDDYEPESMTEFGYRA